MTEERIKELVHQALIDLCLGYELDSTSGDAAILGQLIRAVVAEAQEEGVDAAIAVLKKLQKVGVTI